MFDDGQLCYFHPGSAGEAEPENFLSFIKTHFDSVASDASGFDVFTSFILKHLTGKIQFLGVK